MSIDVFFDLHLLVVPAGRQYQARVVQSPVGQAQIDFDLSFSAGELSGFRWLAQRATEQLRSYGQTSDAPLSVQAFGARLFDAVFSGEVRECLQRSRDCAQQAGHGLRINLRLNDVPELADLPWEYLYETGSSGGFLALSDATPIVRYLELAKTAIALRVPPPLCVLAVTSSPQDLPEVDVEREWRQLHEAVDTLQSQELVRLERLEVPTLSALQHRLRKAGGVHILHFIGHGAYDSDSQTGGVYFQNDDGTHHYVAADDLAMILRDHEPLRLVFLNACEGARGSMQSVFSGAAQTLVGQGIAAVLAMQFPITIEAAMALSHEFYQALADGLPVDAAVSEARKAVKVAGSEFEWATPVLFSRSHDNRILMLPEGDARRIIATQPWEPETVLISGGRFCMGTDASPAPAAEKPRHFVDLPDFRIGKAPVTVREYAEFLTSRMDQAAPQDWFNREPPPGSLNHPVTGVSWYDAMAYCAWLSSRTGRRYTLPSEAEWEKAASWGGEAAQQQGAEGDIETRRYPWGDEWLNGRCNADGSGTSPVDAYPAGASGYGVEDLLGNVQEWTRSRWGTQPGRPDYGYPYDPADGREIVETAKLPSQARLVHRGGSYKSRPADLRCSARGNSLSDSKIGWRGFRVMMALA